MIKKIRTKLILLIVVMGAASILLFRGLWSQKMDIWYWLTSKCPIEFSFLPEPKEDLFSILAEEAKKYNIPQSEDDDEGVEAIEPFFDLADDAYTAIYIYGLEDGLFRAGRAPAALMDNRHGTLFDIGYEWTEGVIEQPREVPMEFKNGYASVLVFFYHSTFFVVPYMIFCLAVSILLFLTVILYFVTRKMRVVEKLKGEILEMASGNLDTPVQEEGQDELGVLAKELDSLRITLNEKFASEQELHKSNQELIAALSHDLRTPLTILKGYLEILSLGRNQQQQEEYIGRCIRKTEDIQELTNRMFEYALVYDEMKLENNCLELVKILPDTIIRDLKEHAEFLELAGFQTKIRTEFQTEKEKETEKRVQTMQGTDWQTELRTDCTVKGGEIGILADEAMLKRVFNNLFSNIIKYADKKTPVYIEILAEPKKRGESEIEESEQKSKETGKQMIFSISIRNRVKAEQNHIESNRIGLKSVRKIMEFMNGDVEVTENEGEFMVKLSMDIV